MRLAIPDFMQRHQINQTGIALINLFADDFFTWIDTELRESVGANWLIEYRKTQLYYLNYNFQDPSNLFKEIIRVSSSPLRIPIRGAIPQRDMVAFFSRLENILDDRNDWVHLNLNFSQENLMSLILDIYPVCKTLNLESTNECDSLLTLLSGVSPDINQSCESENQTLETAKIIQEFNSLVPENEPAIGSIVDEPLDDSSYVLHLTGEISDRRTKTKLSEIDEQYASSLGALLIARKPNGGRLRITKEWVLLAYFEDHWGYLLKVKRNCWFPLE